MRRTPALALLSTAVTLAVAGTTAFVTLDNTVTLTVDGHARQVHGFSRTVGAVLHSAGVPVGPHDSVTPPLAAPVADGSRVTVAHGRQLTLLLDGRSSAPWTTGTTVGSALDQLGIATDGAYLSIPRSTALPLEGLALTVRRPQRISVLVDGHALPVVTTAPSVGEALRSARLVLGPTDRASVALTAYPDEGMVVRVTRISNSRQQLSEPVAVPTVRRPDRSMYKGRTAVLRAGRAGVLVRVFQLTYVDRRLVSKTLVSQRLTVAPQPRVVLVGTRPVPQWTGGRSSGLNWAALARCESSGNPRAVSASGKYRGLYQFDFATWHSVGGSGDPVNASAGERPTVPRFSTAAPAARRGRSAAATSDASLSRPAAPRGNEGLLGAADVRALAETLGVRPRKALGQNFVVDANTVRRMVRIADCAPDDVVLEVGPGLGSLTLGLLPAVRRVVAVEVDPRLAAALPRTVALRRPDLADRLAVVCADAVSMGPPPGEAPTALVANLPYNVAVPVLLNLLDRLESLRSGLVMVQAEVAERLAAAPGSRVYGVPSVKAAWYAELRGAGSVPRTVFWPAPHVDSGLVRFRRRPPPPTTASRAAVFAVVDAAFAQRRKTLRAALAGWAGSPAAAAAALAAAGVDPSARGESLDIEAFARLAAAGPERQP